MFLFVQNKLHKDTYGKSSALVSQPLVIENPAMLAMQEKKSDYSNTNGAAKEPAAPLVYPVGARFMITKLYLAGLGFVCFERRSCETSCDALQLLQPMRDFEISYWV